MVSMGNIFLFYRPVLTVTLNIEMRIVHNLLACIFRCFYILNLLRTELLSWSLYTAPSHVASLNRRRPETWNVNTRHRYGSITMVVSSYKIEIFINYRLLTHWFASLLYPVAIKRIWLSKWLVPSSQWAIELRSPKKKIDNNVFVNSFHLKSRISNDFYVLNPGYQSTNLLLFTATIARIVIYATNSWPINPTFSFLNR